MDIHKARFTGAPRRWTPEEDVKLTSAITNTPNINSGKNKCGKEDKID
jgi:hypothetical protein